MRAPTAWPTKRFGREGEAVDQKSRDVEEMHENGIGGDDDIAGLGAARGEPGKGEDQADGADHDVAIDRQHAHEFGAIEDAETIEARAHAAQAAVSESRVQAMPRRLRQ